MKKKLLALIPFAALLALSSCGDTQMVDPVEPEEPTEPSVPFKPVVAPTELLPVSYSETLYVGETCSIKLLITPLMANDSPLVYESKNPEVATVNEAGLVTAVAPGFTSIVVTSSLDDRVTTEVKISVFNEIKKDKSNTDPEYLALRSAFSAMKTYQKDNVPSPKKLIDLQGKSYDLYKDDKLYSSSTQYNKFMVSVDDAYAYFGGRDTYMKIDGGTESRDFGAYHFVTDANYHSYIYHDGDNSNRYCYVPTEFNLGTGISRIDTLYSILDSIFTSGRDLIVERIEEAMGAEWFKKEPDPTSVMFKSGSYVEDKELYCTYTQHLKQRSTALMEQNLDIPAGLIYEEDDNFKVYWHQGEVKTFFVQYQISYTIGTVKHKLVITEHNTFLRDNEVDIKLPRASDYDQVDDIFDL